MRCPPFFPAFRCYFNVSSTKKKGSGFISKFAASKKKIKNFLLSKVRFITDLSEKIAEFLLRQLSEKSD